MAADKNRPDKGGRAKKAIRGRMPAKKTINLILIDENRISPLKAIPGIILIIILAALFSKFLVADRLVAMTVSANKAARLKADLTSALETIESYGDVENTYAHYTYAGMTQSELNMVDRAQVLGLMDRLQPRQASDDTVRTFAGRLAGLYDGYTGSARRSMTLDSFNQQVMDLFKEVFPPRYAITAWSVSNNLLTMEASGNTLRTLNTLARTVEKDPIVDSCAIVTAKKDNVVLGGIVQARLQVFLQQAEEAEEASAS